MGAEVVAFSRIRSDQTASGGGEWVLLVQVKTESRFTPRRLFDVFCFLPSTGSSHSMPLVHTMLRASLNKHLTKWAAARMTPPLRMIAVESGVPDRPAPDSAAPVALLPPAAAAEPEAISSDGSGQRLRTLPGICDSMSLNMTKLCADRRQLAIRLSDLYRHCTEMRRRDSERGSFGKELNLLVLGVRVEELQAKLSESEQRRLRAEHRARRELMAVEAETAKVELKLAIYQTGEEVEWVNPKKSFMESEEFEKFDILMLEKKWEENKA
ncbi:uncharacterized protein LOC122034933 [Zingiber officinale]|uniref:Uncharacterized protein n=1 Tax=Zingiber officinale TaxID=94328 RepID=A0A8J5C666_ZINOF|nr:uncharacterized protein LOC122034933 [Zingiber officinale]KAG6467900.1 hypothetical protein ZIOFF_072465 [Zingiber officinale]